MTFGKKNPAVRGLQRLYLALIFFFLYAPIAVLVVQSFNASKSRARWGGFTLDWYRALLENEDILRALSNTLSIASLSALAATAIALVACLALVHTTKKLRAAFLGLSNIPMLNAEIVTGISLMLLFLTLGLRMGYGTILLSHITFCIPYAILSIMPRFQQLRTSTYEAALDLGATPPYAFYKVVLPDLLPGIVSALLMSFTMSLDDFIITHFTKGAGVDTLSTKIYTEVKKGIKPEMYALSTLIFGAVLLLLLLVNWPRKDQKKQS